MNQLLILMKNNYIFLFYVGILLYTIGSSLHIYLAIGIYFKLLAIVGILCSFFSFFKADKYIPFQGLPQMIFSFFLFVNIMCIFRGLLSPNTTISALLTQPSYILSYLFPFCFFICDYKNTINNNLTFGIVLLFFELIFCYILRDGLFFESVQNYMMSLEYDGLLINLAQAPIGLCYIFAPFVFLWSFFNYKIKVLFVICFILGLIAALLVGRRSAAGIPSILVLLAVIINVFRNKGFIKGIISSILCVTIILLLSSLFLDYLDLSILTEKLSKDTRTFVEVEFYKDMQIKDWLFGRGMCGTYYDRSWGPDENLHRPFIETGYLNYILHGGLVLLMPYLYFLLKASYLNLFKSNNIIAKMNGSLLFVEIICLYTGGMYCFLSFHCILMACSIRMGFNKEIRYLDDESIIDYLFSDSKLWKLIKK